jgi:hypothetical protein
MTGMTLLLVIIEKVVVANIIDDPLEIASASVVFTQALEKNLKNMMLEIKE